jgi:multidrug transporter EmrE-like cation transporter
MGLVAYWLKTGLAGMAVESLVISVVASPFMWFLAILSIAAFLIMQKALHSHHVSLVSPMIGGISITLPVLLAFFWLGESISVIKWVGIALVLIGTAGLGK